MFSPIFDQLKGNLFQPLTGVNICYLKAINSDTGLCSFQDICDQICSREVNKWLLRNQTYQHQAMFLLWCFFMLFDLMYILTCDWGGQFRFFCGLGDFKWSVCSMCTLTGNNGEWAGVVPLETFQHLELYLMFQMLQY